MKIVQWFTGSRPSRIYLALVAAATMLACWELWAWTQREAEVAGTYPMLATAPALFLTAPLSLLLEWVVSPLTGTDGVYSFIAPVVAGALLNAALLNRLLATLRRRPANRPPASRLEPTR